MFHKHLCRGAVRFGSEGKVHPCFIDALRYMCPNGVCVLRWQVEWWRMRLMEAESLVYSRSNSPNSLNNIHVSYDA